MILDNYSAFYYINSFIIHDSISHFIPWPQTSKTSSATFLFFSANDITIV